MKTIIKTSALIILTAMPSCSSYAQQVIVYGSQWLGGYGAVDRLNLHPDPVDHFVPIFGHHVEQTEDHFGLWAMRPNLQLIRRRHIDGDGFDALGRAGRKLLEEGLGPSPASAPDRSSLSPDVRWQATWPRSAHHHGDRFFSGFYRDWDAGLEYPLFLFLAQLSEKDGAELRRTKVQ